MVSRRQFLRGDFSVRRSEAAGDDGPRCAAIGATCMAFANVVCRSCADVCPEGAIRFAPRIMASALPLVDEKKCTGCGDCIAACPASAIKLV